ncbi:tyrosine-type recombinase/integrase [Anaerotignum sp.]
MKGGTRKRGKSWSYYFDAATIGGNRKKVEKGGFRTKKEAEAALAKALVEYDNSGMVFTPSEISVADYLDYWYENRCKEYLSDNSLDRYRTVINNHLKPAFGKYHLKALQAASIQEFVNTLKKKDLAESTIKNILTVFSSSLDYAIHPMQYIKENPCRLVKITMHPEDEISDEEVNTITDEEFGRIIEHFPFGSRYYMYLMLGWHCGLRIRECTGLTWDDIDLENRTLTVNRQLVLSRIDGKNHPTFKQPKRNSVRKIVFGETLHKALTAEKRRQAKFELLYGKYYTVYAIAPVKDSRGRKKEMLVPMEKGDVKKERICPFVCRDNNGELVNAYSFNSCYRIINNKLGIPFSHHSLRHTHATKLIEAGANVKAVQYRLGHKKVTTTMNTYVHHTDTMAQDVADLFEKAITKNATAL